MGSVRIIRIAKVLGAAILIAVSVFYLFVVVPVLVIASVSAAKPIFAIEALPVEAAGLALVAIWWVLIWRHRRAQP